MFTSESKPPGPNPAQYQIQIGGELQSQWSDWFGGLKIESERKPDGSTITILQGAIRDQAELRGVLIKLLDLNLVLISVQQILSAPDK